jgi:hypothetical protein
MDEMKTFYRSIAADERNTAVFKPVASKPKGNESQ